MKKREFLIIISIFLLLGLVATRQILKTPGILGHQWDWVIPPWPMHLRRMFELSRFVWWDVSLGNPTNDYGLTGRPFFAILGALGFLEIGGEIVSKGLLIATSAIAGSSMYLLLGNLLKRSVRHSPNRKDIRWASFVAAFFYAFSPFLFNEFIGGATTQFISYATLPLGILFFTKRKLVSFVLAFSVISLSVQNSFLAMLIIGTWILFTARRKKYLKFGLKAALIYTVLNTYWIAPALLNLRNIATSALNPEQLLISHISAQVPSLGKALLGLGYFNDFFFKTVVAKLGNLWFILIGLGEAVLLRALFKAKIKREGVGWFSLFLLSLIVATGGRAPFGNLVLLAYRRIPLMNAFRSPQHWLTLTTFSLAIVLSISSFAFLNQSSKFLKGWKRIFLVALFGLWATPFFLKGDLGFSALEKFGGGNYLTSFTLSESYEKTLSSLAHTATGKVLFVPMSYSPFYLKTNYQKEGQGGDPLQTYNVPPVVNKDMFPNPKIREFMKGIEHVLYFGENPNSLPVLLRLAGVSDVILREDIFDNFGRFSKAHRYDEISQFLNQIPELEMVANYPDISWWRLRNPLPKIYSVSDILVVQGAVSDFHWAAERKKGEENFAILTDRDLPQNPPLPPAITQTIIKINTVTRERSTNLLGDASFEKKEWRARSDGPEPKFSSVAFDGKVSLQLDVEGDQSAGAWNEILDFDSRDSYLISFYYKNLLGKPARFLLEESTGDSWEESETRQIKFAGGFDLEAATDWLKFETLYQPHPGAGKSRLVFLTQESLSRSINLIDNIHIIQTTQEKQITQPETPTETPPEIEGDGQPQIAYSRVNPTHYEVSISNAQIPLILIFSESFHPDWQLTPGNSTHFTINGFANAWLIEPQGREEMNFTIRFTPQKSFETSKKISLASLATVLGIQLIKWIRKKRSSQIS